MDDRVLAAMRRWPGVAPVYGWMRLDARGRWRILRRDRADFDPTREAEGETIGSPSLVDYIGRNYAPDPEGAWYWQNGPQRVYLALETAPLIYRVLERRDGRPGKALVAHTGFRAHRLVGGWLDPAMRVYLLTDLGPGMVHDQDLAQLDLSDQDENCNAQALEHAAKARLILRWTDLDATVQSLSLRCTEDAATSLGFVRNPQPAV